MDFFFTNLYSIALTSSNLQTPTCYFTQIKNEDDDDVVEVSDFEVIRWVSDTF